MWSTTSSVLYTNGCRTEFGQNVGDDNLRIAKYRLIYNLNILYIIKEIFTKVKHKYVLSVYNIIYNVCANIIYI